MLLLKNCKSSKQSQMETLWVSSKKDHHWSKKNPKLCLGLEISHMSCLFFRTRKKETTNANKKSVNQKNFFLYSMSNKNFDFWSKKLWQEVSTRWLKFLYPVWFVSWCFNCSNLVSTLTRSRIISRVDFKNTRKKYSCFTCFRRNHSWLLLKNCKSPKQITDGITVSVVKKGPSLVQEKNPKLYLGLKLPHSLFVL